MENDVLVNNTEILVVEDNPSDAELTLRALKRRGVVNNIFVVRDGEEALEFIFHNGRYTERKETLPLKVILLDLKLPKVSGLEVLAKIKSDEETKKIPVVVVTSSHEDTDLKKAYELGVNSYIVKPMEFESFVRSIGEAGMYWLALNETTK